MKYAVPVLVLAALIALFAIGLTMDPTKVPSPLIGKPAPAFRLPQLDDPALALTAADLKGPLVVNFFASWCTPCLQEHPLLLELARQGVRIVGISYKDTPEATKQWLAQHGSPYRTIALDAEGKAGLDWGVYGVPETYLVDAQGKIEFKQVGPMTREVWQQQFKPVIASSK